MARPQLTPQESREVSDLSLEEQRSYWAFRRRRNHSDALACACESVAARYHRQDGDHR